MKKANESNNIKDRINFDTEASLYEDVKSLSLRVQQQIPDDPSLFSLKSRFNSSLQFFFDLYQKNQSLLGIISEKNAVIITNAGKISSILKVIHEDELKLKKYRQDYDEVVSVMSTLNNSEKQSRELLTRLRKNMAKLSEEVNKGCLYVEQDEEPVTQVNQDVSNLKEEVQKGTDQIIEYKKLIQTEKDAICQITDSIANMANMCASYESELHSLDNTLIKIKKEKPMICEQLNSIENNITQMKQDIFDSESECKNISNLIIKSKLEKSSIVKSQLEELSQLRSIKQKIQSNTRHLNEYLRSSSVITDRIHKTDNSVELCSNEIKGLNDKMEWIDSQIEQSNTEMSEIQELQRNYQVYKSEMRSKAKEFRETASSISSQFVISKNENLRVERMIESIQKDKLIVKQQLNEESLVTSDVLESIKCVSNDKMAEKKVGQSIKTTIRNLEIEIEMKESDIASTEAQYQLAIDENQGLINKINHDKDILDNMNQKIQQQNSLTEDLRNERNIFKRRWESLLKEVKELAMVYEDQEKEFNMLSKKKFHVEKKAALKHFQVQDIRQQIHQQKFDIEELSKLLDQTRLTINSLISETQLLSSIHGNAMSDRKVIKNELSSTSTTIEMIHTTLNDRTKKVESLKSEIQTLIARIEKGYHVYEQKQQEITKLEKEARVLTRSSNHYEEQRYQLSKKEDESYFLFNQLNQEKQKYASMVKEMGIPRNVHRWQLLSTIDPIYSKNLKYFSEITFKLDESHNLLLRLSSKKDKLQFLLTQMFQDYESLGGLTYGSVCNQIEQYKKDISSKDNQILSINNQLIEIQDKINNYTNKNSNVREKLSQRRVVYSNLRCRNASSKLSSRPSTPSVFITEQDNQFSSIGGGFIVKQKREPVPENPNTELIKVDPINVSSRSPRKKDPSIITRPSTTPHIRRAKNDSKLIQ